MSVVSKQSNCSVLISSKFVEKTEAELLKAKPGQDSHKKVAYFMIIGTKVNVEAAATLFDWLKAQLEAEATRGWPTFKTGMQERGLPPGDPIPYRVNFIAGATNEINLLMEERRRASENFTAVTALAVNYREANDRFITENFRVGKPAGQTTTKSNRYAYGMGKEAGGRIERSRSNSLTD